jgi:glycosyltransferase involved in cell wall biosynthesis
MKIYFIGQKGIPAKSGGVEKHVEALATSLAKQGQEVFVYTRPNYTNRKLTEYQGVKLISRPSLSTKHLDALSHTLLCSLDVLFRQADVVHFQAIGPASLLWLVKIFKPKTKIVFTFHCQDYYHQKWGRLARWYLHFGEMVGCRLADEVIAVSRGLVGYIATKYSRQARYIPNGVMISGNSDNSHILNKLGLLPQKYILAVSRLVRHKGLQYLIEAFRRLKTDYRLVIVGGGAHTDDYVAELKSLAAGDERIILAGEQAGDNLTQLFSQAGLFVQPSESEGLSVALLEAMAYGLPVLISDIPENLEAIGGYGQSFHSRDIDDLTVKLQQWLDNPEDGYKLAQQAQIRVRAEYDWFNITNSTLDIYRLSQA